MNNSDFDEAPGKNEDRQERLKRRSKELGQQALDEARDAANNAWATLLTLIKNPTGGQSQALEELENKAIFSAGIFFMVLFALAITIFANDFFEGFTGYLQATALAIIIPCSMTLGFYIINIFFSEKESNIYHCIFTSGIVTVPLSIMLIIVGLVGVYQINQYTALVVLVYIFSTCTTILFINSSLIDVYKLSSRQSVLFTPLLLSIALVASWVMGEVFT